MAAVTHTPRPERTQDEAHVTRLDHDDALGLIELMLRMTTRAKRERDPIGWMRDELVDMHSLVESNRD